MQTKTIDVSKYSIHLDQLSKSLYQGTSKAQPLNSKVLTPTGFVEICSIKVGDEIITGNGKSSFVTRVFHEGIKDAYKITFNDRTSTECCKEHLWTVKTRDDRRRGHIRTVELNDMMNNIRVENGRRLNYSVEYITPVEFKKRELKIDPYYMGVLLGDGGLTNTCPIITSPDKVIIDRIYERLPQSDTMVSFGKLGYRIRKVDNTIKDSHGFFTKSKTQEALSFYGLMGRDSKDKFIPSDYLNTTVEDRWELLRGLLDTDGYSGGNCIEFSTTSINICQGVLFLVRSLGGYATYVKKQGQYRRDGVIIQCNMSYRMTIQFRADVKPFYCHRKAERYCAKRKELLKFVESIEFVEKKPCMYIIIEDPCHLYITDDFIITNDGYDEHDLFDFDRKRPRAQLGRG